MEKNQSTTTNKSSSLSHLSKLYLDQLSENEKKALEIAKSHLESSFCLEKSNEFLQFKIKQEDK
jgi:hypothetical protein